MPRDAKGKFKSYATHVDAFADTMDLMRKLIPTHVVFNGAVGALTGKNAMPGRSVRPYLIIHSQADRDSRLYTSSAVTATTSGRRVNSQIHRRPISKPGLSAVAPPVQPSTSSSNLASYAYVNHNMIEAFELGATAHFRVEGPWNEDLMTQVRAPRDPCRRPTWK